ncbi:MAG TPA: hypothetical protein VGF67_33335 [Ktedonobacteraceae bacterium]
MDGASEQIRQQYSIQATQRLAEPLPGWQGLFDIETRGLGKIEHEMEAEFDDEQRVLEEKRTQLRGGDQAFADANEESFQVGRLGMSWATTLGLLSLPLCDQGPIELGEEGAIGGDKRVMVEESGEGGLVKDGGSTYQSMGLLLLVYSLRMNTLQMEFLRCQETFPFFSCKRRRCDE